MSTADLPLPILALCRSSRRSRLPKARPASTTARLGSLQQLLERFSGHEAFLAVMGQQLRWRFPFFTTWHWPLEWD